MFAKTIASAIIAAALSGGLSSSADAMGGGGGENPTFMTMHNPDGSSVTVRKTRKGRTIVRRDPSGNREVREVPKKGTSWARNETTGVTSVGVRPGLRIVISPFGIGIGF